jgi:hypothetical protein
MQRELGFSRAEASKAAYLAEAAGFVLDYVRHDPSAITPRMPNRSEWLGFLAQARLELEAL